MPIRRRFGCRRKKKASAVDWCEFFKLDTRVRFPSPARLFSIRDLRQTARPNDPNFYQNFYLLTPAASESETLYAHACTHARDDVSFPTQLGPELRLS
jgi:hypothetical protein